LTAIQSGFTSKARRLRYLGNLLSLNQKLPETVPKRTLLNRTVPKRAWRIVPWRSWTSVGSCGDLGSHNQISRLGFRRESSLYPDIVSMLIAVLVLLFVVFLVLIYRILVAMFEATSDRSFTSE